MLQMKKIKPLGLTKQANSKQSVPCWPRIQIKRFSAESQTWATKIIKMVRQGSKVGSGSLPTTLKAAVKSILGPLCCPSKRVLKNSCLTQACAITCLTWWKWAGVLLDPDTRQSESEITGGLSAKMLCELLCFDVLRRHCALRVVV